ncbi:hypothetical protein CONLIGDRAFT_642406 [Coniochaeta ligniaria NRRL 30616]|uniref:Uncharacterized protein n=1 Tax=Coniochaeta ligniaria NRRL 30616 TaxID=1408157 RepID=A0A1J7JH73_9PEZI|nr:hypothetical protein CONLIGDRAFT_642406 [Coniochaeta ligniaria NRRL 30616]
MSLFAHSKPICALAHGLSRFLSCVPGEHCRLPLCASQSTFSPEPESMKLNFDYKVAVEDNSNIQQRHCPLSRRLRRYAPTIYSNTAAASTALVLLPPACSAEHTSLSLTYLSITTIMTSTSPKPSSSEAPHSPVVTKTFPGDTPETVSLLATWATRSQAVNPPTREVYFPHARPAGLPATTKCVGRPGRPALTINTDITAVSTPHVGTPPGSRAPARGGPPDLCSGEMVGWLKGPRPQEVEETFGDEEEDVVFVVKTEERSLGGKGSDAGAAQNMRGELGKSRWAPK